MEMNEKKPKVSVCVVTYNQEKYISQCLQSIVDQETDFEFEVIVSDDCSTDGTRAIVQEFADKYPGMVKPIFHDKNIGAYKNFVFIHGQANGEYVAHMDGDDCALPGKLRAQANSLDLNPDISFAVHAVTVLGTDKLIGADTHYPTKGSIQDLLRLGTYFVNSSVMYRKEYEFSRANKFEAVDYYLHIERASKGSIFLDRRVFGCYRDHEQGISKNVQHRKKIENLYEAAFDRALELGVSNELVQSARLRRRMVFAIAYYLSGDIESYQEKIKIFKGDFIFATKKHLILHWTRYIPSFLGVYTRIRGLV